MSDKHSKENQHVYVVRAGDSYGDKSPRKAFGTKEQAEEFVAELKEEWTKDEDAAGGYTGPYGMEVSCTIDEVEFES